MLYPLSYGGAKDIVRGRERHTTVFEGQYPNARSTALRSTLGSNGLTT